MLDRSQKFVWGMVVGGFLLSFISVVLMVLVVGDGSFRWVFGASSVSSHNAIAYLMLGLCLAGAGMIVVGVFFGLAASRSNDAKKPVKNAENVQIVALIINNSEDMPVYDVGMYDADELLCYAQVVMPSGERREFRTSYHLLQHMGEGLTGNITYQGRWLCSFQRQLLPTAQVGPDPFVR